MLVLEACWAEESLVRREKDRRSRAFYSLCKSGARGFIESRWIGDVAVLDDDLVSRLLTGVRESKVNIPCPSGLPLHRSRIRIVVDLEYTSSSSDDHSKSM